MHSRDVLDQRRERSHFWGFVRGQEFETLPVPLRNVGLIEKSSEFVQSLYPIQF